MKRSKNSNAWRFFRAGGFDQVRLDTAQELLSLDKLDQKLWVALACPVDNVHFDARTLALIDSDKDGRIRAAELIAAIAWAGKMLKNPEDLIDHTDGISVQSINDGQEEGKTLTTAIRNALSALGKEESGSVTVADTQVLEKVLSDRPLNGDGIITEEVTEDESLKGVIRDIIAVTGSLPDRSGKPGIDVERVESFFKQALDFNAWLQEAKLSEAQWPLGPATGEAAGAILAVKHKIDDYFIRCAVAQFARQAPAFFNGDEKASAAHGSGLLTLQDGELVKLPLARIEAGRALPLQSDLNPAWAFPMSRFEEVAVRPFMGVKASMSEHEWKAMLSAFAPWFAWQEKKPKGGIEALGVERLPTLLCGGKKEALLAFIEKDKAVAPTFTALIDVEKLVRFLRDIHRLCTNFVNFKDFYSKGDPAIFQAGTLFLDQRSSSLCIKIDDVGKHSGMAAMAGAYLVYCECRRKAQEGKLTIVAALTNGDSENVMVGRNGVFYDRRGNDWDATVIKIIENPISIRQAFWHPYKGLVRMIESQVSKRATTADAQSTEKLSQTAAVAATVDKNKTALPAQPPLKLDVGVVAALGVAAGALGTFIATFLGYVSGIVKLGPLAVIGSIIGLFLLISAPSIVLAFIKLRKRNLGPILDAGGWAINAKARINVPFGAALTQVAALPPGSQRDLRDPYAEKKSPWPKIMITALVVYMAYAALNHFGFINEWTHGRIGLKKQPSTQVILKNPSNNE